MESFCEEPKKFNLHQRANSSDNNELFSSESFKCPFPVVQWKKRGVHNQLSDHTIKLEPASEPGREFLRQHIEDIFQKQQPEKQDADAKSTVIVEKYEPAEHNADAKSTVIVEKCESSEHDADLIIERWKTTEQFRFRISKRTDIEKFQ